MRRVLTGVGSLALLTILYVPSDASPSAAVMAKNSTCVVLDAEGGLAWGDDSLVLMNAGGKAMVKCSVKGVANSQGKAVRLDYESTGMLCFTAGGPTEDWHETISASGNATLTCMTKR
jgi:hypothetical protein